MVNRAEFKRKIAREPLRRSRAWIHFFLGDRDAAPGST
jgi:hypothetical protein